MATASTSERLTPLDLLMPRAYIATLLTFSTTQPTSAVSQALQSGLDGLVTQLPWISARIFPATLESGSKPTLEMRWVPNEGPPSLIDKGSISAAYAALSTLGMPPDAIPEDVWPVPYIADDAFFARGVPVFAASLFRFTDNQGVGLCVCMHHNAVDATGLAGVLRMWVQSMGHGSSPSYLSPEDDRLTRLKKALCTDLDAVSTRSLDSLFASHPEHSKTPPTYQPTWPSCTSKLFRIPVTKINAVKELLRGHVSALPTTNTVLCALIWSAITHVRKQRNPALANESSRLATAVNGRRRISEEFSTSESPYLGNVVLYSLVELPVGDLTAFFDQDSAQQLAAVCDIISRSQSSAHINSRHIAEVYSLADRVGDYRTVSVGWDLLRSRDLTLSSWAGLDLYDMDFPTTLGKLDFVRMRHAETDGMGMVMPRRRIPVEAGTPNELLEVVLMLRRDDMDALERDKTWKTFVS